MENDWSGKPAVETEESATSAYCTGEGVASSAGMLPQRRQIHVRAGGESRATESSARTSPL